MLVESVNGLTDRGVEKSRMLAKLRRDPDVWPTWAEIRGAELLARHSRPDARLLIEPRRAQGRHSDFAFEVAGQGTSAIEFKAIGLSDAEQAFSRSMGPLLSGLMPRTGILTMHVRDTSTDINMNRDERRARRREAERLAKYLHPVVRRVGAAVIVGHGTEESYTRRLSQRFGQALPQLGPDQECWVAFHWSNGASIDMVRHTLALTHVPDHIAGIILIGSVAIPGQLDNYVTLLPAPFEGKAREEWQSDTSVEDAKAVLAFVDQSSGVRPTCMRVPGPRRMEPFLRRDGARRILPFNLLLSPDPETFRSHSRSLDDEGR